MFLSYLLAFAFLGLSLIHFNWVIGGRFGFDISLPTTVEGKRVLNPKRIDSFIVALGLSGFSLFYLDVSGLFDVGLNEKVVDYLGWMIPSIFLIRALGDFKYVGFFKKIKQTKFAQADSKWFSPLCLFLAICGYMLKLL